MLNDEEKARYEGLKEKLKQAQKDEAMALMAGITEKGSAHNSVIERDGHDVLNSSWNLSKALSTSPRHAGSAFEGISNASSDKVRVIKSPRSPRVASSGSKSPRSPRLEASITSIDESIEIAKRILTRHETQANKAISGNSPSALVRAELEEYTEAINKQEQALKQSSEQQKAEELIKSHRDIVNDLYSKLAK